jgi:hypothetical protein
MRTSSVSLLAVFIFVACTPTAPLRSPTTMTAADETADATVAPRCKLTASGAEGCEPRDVESLVEPVRPRIEHCRARAGGKLVVRVRKAPSGKLAFDVEPGSSLDPAETKCVLEALSTLDIDEASTAWTGLNVTPTGFTSLLTIEW